MATLRLIAILLAFYSTTFAQAPGANRSKAIFNHTSTQIIVPKSSVSDTSHVISIKWDGSLGNDKKVILDIESLTDKALDKIIGPRPAKSYSFGTDFSNEYQVTLKFLKDDDTLKTEVLRLILKDFYSSILPYDTLTIVYQKTASSKTTIAETPLTKSIKDIKNDISDLKRQILEGDTSRIYLGKFIIKDKIISTSSTANKEPEEGDERLKIDGSRVSKKSLNYLDIKKSYSYADFKVNEKRILDEFNKQASDIAKKRKELETIRNHYRVNQDKLTEKDTILAHKEAEFKSLTDPYKMIP